MSATDLAAVAQAMVARGRGVLAADESNATITKRFAALDIESTEENRRAYRDTLLSTPGLEEYISGVILYDETIRQSSADGTPFPKMLERKGILPGIKVDTGSKPLALDNDEQVTEGLDGLRGRSAKNAGLAASSPRCRRVSTTAKPRASPPDWAMHGSRHAWPRSGPC